MSTTAPDGVEVVVPDPAEPEADPPVETPPVETPAVETPDVVELVTDGASRPAEHPTRPSATTRPPAAYTRNESTLELPPATSSGGDRT
jgi:hypothetical protein